MASQKLTVPLVTEVEPDATVAFRVTGLPKATVVTGVPPEDTASAVVEAAIGGRVYVAVATADDVNPETAAMASIVSVELTVIAPLYMVEEVVGCVPVVPLVMV